MSLSFLIISGPTASGKTNWTMQLHQATSWPIISFDSRQFYREMRIGTARPTEEECKQAPHRFVADRSIAEPLSAGGFASEARDYIKSSGRNHFLLVGGSGLYLKALLYGIDTFPEIDERIRHQIKEGFDLGGIQWLSSEIKRLDPVKWEQTDHKNPQRMMRILGILMAGGAPFDHWKKSEALQPFHCLNIAPEWERSTLYRRIDERVERMMAEGLEEEVRSLVPHRQKQALKSVGYSELFDHFDGNISRDKAIEQIKRNSRRYAKRQCTWWNHQPPPVHWIAADQNILDIEQVRCFIEQKKNKESLR